MKLFNLKRYTVLILLAIIAFGYISYRFGLFNSFIHNYEEKKLSEDLDKIIPPANTVTGAAIDTPESNQSSKAPVYTSDPIPNNTPSGILPAVQKEPEQSVVSIVQSYKASAKDINSDDIRLMVRNAVKLAGGFDGLIKDGQTVVIKPNLVQMHSDITQKLFAKELNGITTDWRIVKSAVELVREYNPSGKVYVMEGSAGDKTMDTMKYFNYTHEYIKGVDEFIAIEEDSGGWQEFDSQGLLKIDLPGGLLHKQYYLNKKYKEADVLISIPCLKNNSGTVITGGIKNVAIGATPANIYGPAPGNLSRIKMVDHAFKKGDLDKWIYDYYVCKPVDFVIIDGLQGFQNGPCPWKKDSENTDIMNMRLIVAGRDAVAVDTVEALVEGWDPQSVNYLRYLEKGGMGNLDTAKITVLGNKVDEVRKFFTTKYASAGGIKITDNTPPKLSIGKYDMENNLLNISLSADKETTKVEVYIDDVFFNAEITPGFSRASVDINNLTAGNHTVTVYAYDRFFNHSEQKLEITK